MKPQIWLMIALVFSLCSLAVNILAIVKVDYPKRGAFRIEVTRIFVTGFSIVAAVFLLTIKGVARNTANVIVLLMSIACFTLLVLWCVGCGVHFYRYRKIDKDCKEGNYVAFYESYHFFTWDENKDYGKNEQEFRIYCHNNHCAKIPNTEKEFYCTYDLDDENFGSCDELDIEYRPKDMECTTIDGCQNSNLYKISQCVGKRGADIYQCKSEQTEEKLNSKPEGRRLNNIINYGCLLNRHWNYSIICYLFTGLFWLIVTVAWIMCLVSTPSSGEEDDGVKIEEGQNNVIIEGRVEGENEEKPPKEKNYHVETGYVIEKGRTPYGGVTTNARPETSELRTGKTLVRSVNVVEEEENNDPLQVTPAEKAEIKKQL